MCQNILFFFSFFLSLSAFETSEQEGLLSGFIFGHDYESAYFLACTLYKTTNTRR